MSKKFNFSSIVILLSGLLSCAAGVLFQKLNGRFGLMNYDYYNPYIAYGLMGVVMINIMNAAGAPIILGILVSYILVRKKGKVANLIDTLIMFPYVIPGSVLGIGLIVAFNRKPVVLVGTAAIMIISYVIRKLPYVLPEQKIINTCWMHYDSIEAQHNVKMFSREYYKIFGSYLDAAVYSGQTMLLLPVITPAFDTEPGSERLTAQLVDIREDAEGNFSFDFAKMHAFIDFALAHGIEQFEMPPMFNGLALMKQKGICMTIYSDSRNALSWVKQKKCKTKLERTSKTEELFKMIERAENWLKTHTYSDIPILKWETEEWGEVPADFGRK